MLEPIPLNAISMRLYLNWFQTQIHDDVFKEQNNAQRLLPIGKTASTFGAASERAFA